jgi:hypothetical protein
MTINILAMLSCGMVIQYIGRKVPNTISERNDTLVPLYSAKDGIQPFAEEKH